MIDPSLPLVMWTTPVAMWLLSRGWVTPAWATWTGGACLASAFAVLGQSGPMVYVLHLFLFALVGLAMGFEQATERRVRDHFRRRLNLLHERQALNHRALNNLEKERLEVKQDLDYFQHRSRLVETMATELDAGEILDTLGSLWRNVAGVRGCLLLRRPPRASWSVVFSANVNSPAEWSAALNNQGVPELSRRIRRFQPLDRHPLFPGQRLSTPLALVPFVGDKEVLALGVLDLTDEFSDESLEQINVERKLVSVGLRRCHLFDIMTERSRHDALTGVFLRRALTERLEEAVRKALRYQSPVFFALLDIDHFKTINDRWGHLAGDRVLVQLAELVRQRAHPGITFGRFGGDEFAMVMECETLADALHWLEGLREAAEAVRIKEGGDTLRYTLSLGLASFLPEKPLIPDLIARADRALYQAKHLGRNRLMVWGPMGPAEWNLLEKPAGEEGEKSAGGGT